MKSSRMVQRQDCVASIMSSRALTAPREFLGDPGVHNKWFSTPLAKCPLRLWDDTVVDGVESRLFGSQLRIEL
ncbi:hypothetical protein AVEN_182878-1 [Araneus ventricosus]|uniref:Uncharacterized protein n=1 Tax=Araneus ventricosus TaxID=182803 RepID=A0A4Y2C0R4_ARAVE|nr:hypothetical protein AVEN_182878-1 [Araneus ventricosus]